MVLFISLALPFLVAFVGSAATMPAIPGWYSALEKPFFSPPNWLFGPVWTVLYLFMGVSFYLVVKKGLSGTKKHEAVVIYFFQLGLNLLWSVVFFGLRQPLMAFFIIITLWLLILAMIKRFSAINKKAGLLQIPYLCWVTFASLLNLAVYLLNR